VDAGHQAGRGESRRDGPVGGDPEGPDVDSGRFQRDVHEDSGREVVAGRGLLLAEFEDG
jgi:hypothetical protein